MQSAALCLSWLSAEDTCSGQIGLLLAQKSCLLGSKNPGTHRAWHAIRYSCFLLQELLGKGPQHDEHLLDRAVQLLGLVLEPHEAQAMYVQLFAVLARAARTEQLCPSESPFAGPYAAVALAGARFGSTALHHFASSWLSLSICRSMLFLHLRYLWGWWDMS